MDSWWSPHTCHGVHLESTWSPSGVHQEFTWSPSGCVGECNLQARTRDRQKTKWFQEEIRLHWRYFEFCESIKFTFITIRTKIIQRQRNEAIAGKPRHVTTSDSSPMEVDSPSTNNEMADPGNSLAPAATPTSGPMQIDKWDLCH